MNVRLLSEMNSEAVIKERKGLRIYNYVSKMKGLFIIRPVNNDINALLRDAQKLTYEHVIKPMIY
jgi:hypothetical protein